MVPSSGADSENCETDDNDDDNVELEKSNVLLMGPTGSGSKLPGSDFLSFEKENNLCGHSHSHSIYYSFCFV